MGFMNKTIIAAQNAMDFEFFDLFLINQTKKTQRNPKSMIM